MMATAKRERILTALAARLGALRNPYPNDYDAVPMTTLLEGEETVTDRDYDDAIITLPVVVEGIDRYGESEERTTAANALLARLIAATVGNDKTLGGLCETIRYTGGSTLFSDAGSELIGIVARFDLIYRHSAGSPYG